MLIKKLFKLKITTQFKPAVFKLKFELNFNVYYKHVLKDTICKYCYCILSFYSLNLLFYSFFVTFICFICCEFLRVFRSFTCTHNDELNLSRISCFFYYKKKAK